jgi:hypothetical protein
MWSLDDKLSGETIVEPRNIKVYYQCSSYPQCVLDYVKRLVRNHTSWLMMGGSQYIQLWRALENILIQSIEVDTSKSRKCYKSDKEFSACPKSTIVCKATIIDTTRKNLECGEPKYAPIQVYLKIIRQTKNDLFQRTIDFTCDFDGCNSEDIGKRIRETIDKYFDFLPIFTTSLLKVQPSTTTIKSTHLTTSKIITTTKIKTTDITNITMSYSATDYETQSSELTTFAPITQNETQFSVLLTTELITDNDVSLLASIYFIICMILFHFVVLM